MIRITNITRGYLNEGDRRRAVKQLRRRGYDYFVEYVDTAARFALCYGKTTPSFRKDAGVLHAAAAAVALACMRQAEQLPLNFGNG